MYILQSCKRKFVKKKVKGLIPCLDYIFFLYLNTAFITILLFMYMTNNVIHLAHLRNI